MFLHRRAAMHARSIANQVISNEMGLIFYGKYTACPFLSVQSRLNLEYSSLFYQASDIAKRKVAITKQYLLHIQITKKRSENEIHLVIEIRKEIYGGFSFIKKELKECTKFGPKFIQTTSLKKT
jgi:hypothetical protein